MQVSVIIPVYNAAPFIEEAVQSALIQPETVEIILVDDGSTDGSYEICQKLAQNPKIQLFTHPNRENKRAGATRNLGILQATCEFIAFLDADDYYLENRFAKAKEVFLKYPDADGTYGLMTLHFHTEQGKKLYKQRRGNTRTTYHLQANTPPEKLFEAYILDTTAFSFPTMIIRRDRITDELLFNEELKQVQDIDFSLNWALNRRLYPASIQTPILVYRIHDNNTIHRTKESCKYGYAAYKIWYDKMFNYNWPKSINRSITRHLLAGVSCHPSRVIRFVLKLPVLLFLILRRPWVLTKLL